MKRQLELKSDDNRFFKQFFLHNFKKYKWNYFLGACAVVVLNALEMLPALFFKEMSNASSESELNYGIKFYAITIAFAYIGIAVLRFAWRFYFMITARKIETKVKRELYANLLRAPFSVVSKLKVGEVVSLLSQDVSDIRMFMGPAILVFVDMTAYFCFVPFVLYWTLGIKFLWLLLPLLSIPIVMFFYDRSIRKAYIASSEDLAKISDHVYEDTVGVKVFRVLGLLAIRRTKFKNLLNDLYDHRIHIAKLNIILDSFLNGVIFLSYFILIFLAYLALSEQVETFKQFASLGTIVLALQVLDKFVWPLMAIAWIASTFQKSKAAIKRLRLLFELEKDYNGQNQLEGALRSVKVKNLSFQYNDDGPRVLKGIDLEISSGEKVGIVGDVGSGKSTLIKIMATLFNHNELCEASTIFYNDIEIKDLDKSTVRKQLSYINQEVSILNNTLQQNIANEPSPDLKRVMESIERASFSEDLETFPDGLDTSIGEKGINLSGGQKQRVAIARSFYSKAQLYLWDDAISALDIATERNVIQSIYSLNPDALLILATHRPSALRNFTKIYVMGDGQIQECGSFEELMGKKQRFYHLYQYELKTRAEQMTQGEHDA